MTIVNSGPGPQRAPKATPPREVLRPAAQPEDGALENALRPDSFSSYAGQRELKESLGIAIQAALHRQEPLDHLLLYGPPGLGKTSLAMLIGKEMGGTVKLTSAPALERPRDIAGLLASLQAGDLLFIDEIHRLNRLAEEILYPAMEDFSLDITIGKGSTARVKRLPLPRFTLVGATTKAGALSSPLRDRFGLVHRLNFYEEDELSVILSRAARILSIGAQEEGLLSIARRARGTPRVANRLLKRVRDYAQVRGDGQISHPIAEEALDRLGIDRLGLDPTDRRLLEIIIRQHRGGPVGIETLAVALNEDAQTLEDVHEPYLVQSGMIARTPRGRMATPAARQHLGFPVAEGAAEDLRLF